MAILAILYAGKFVIGVISGYLCLTASIVKLIMFGKGILRISGKRASQWKAFPLDLSLLDPICYMGRISDSVSLCVCVCVCVCLSRESCPLIDLRC